MAIIGSYCILMSVEVRVPRAPYILIRQDRNNPPISIDPVRIAMYSSLSASHPSHLSQQALLERNNEPCTVSPVFRSAFFIPREPGNSSLRVDVVGIAEPTGGISGIPTKAFGRNSCWIPDFGRSRAVVEILQQGYLTIAVGGQLHIEQYIVVNRDRKAITV